MAWQPPDEVPEHLLALAVPLDEDGEEYVWAPAEALALIESLRGTRVAIEGGDVYRREAWGFVPTYESWSCERLPGEGSLDYARRSRDVALTTIETWVEDHAGDTFYLMRLTDQQDAA